MKLVVYKGIDENGTIELMSSVEIDLNKALKLCREYKLKDGDYINVYYKDKVYIIKREIEGIVLDLFDKDFEFIDGLGYLMISAGDFKEYLKGE